jgi:hypothetical protein
MRYIIVTRFFEIIFYWQAHLLDGFLRTDKLKFTNESNLRTGKLNFTNESNITKKEASRIRSFFYW